MILLATNAIKSLNSGKKSSFASCPKSHYVSSNQNPGYLVYVGDYTTQLYRDLNKLLI